MKAKSARSRSRNSGVTRMPSSPQTTRSPISDLAQLAARRRGRRRRRSPRPCAAARPRSIRRATRTCGAHVGGRIEIVRDAAVAVGGAQQRVLLAGPGCSRAASDPRPAGAGRPRVGADTLSEMRENSSLVRPIAKFSTSNAPPRSITLSKIALRMFESIRWPSAPTTAEWARVSCMTEGCCGFIVDRFDGYGEGGGVNDGQRSAQDAPRRRAAARRTAGRNAAPRRGHAALRTGRAGPRAGEADAQQQRRATTSRRSPTSCGRCRLRRRCPWRAASPTSSISPTSPNSITGCGGAGSSSGSPAAVRSRRRSRKRCRGCVGTGVSPDALYRGRLRPAHRAGDHRASDRDHAAHAAAQIQPRRRRAGRARSAGPDADRARGAARVDAPRDRRRLAHRGGPARTAVAARRSPLGHGGVRGDDLERRSRAAAARSTGPCAGS